MITMQSTQKDKLTETDSNILFASALNYGYERQYFDLKKKLDHREDGEGFKISISGSPFWFLVENRFDGTENKEEGTISCNPHLSNHSDHRNQKFTSGNDFLLQWRDWLQLVTRNQTSFDEN